MIVIFDLDGTIVNTYPVIKKTLIELFNLYLPNLKYDEKLLESFFGPPLVESFAKIAPDKVTQEFLISEYRRINKKYYEAEITLFPNIKEVLKELKLKNYKLAILSNRIKSLIDVALEVTKIKDYFDLVIGVDNVVNPKPNPMGIYKIIEELNDKNVIYVGDTVTDIQTAKNAYVKAVGVTWSLTTKEEFIQANADYIISDPNELLTILEGSI